jgi:AraC-like DNA-binding protein
MNLPASKYLISNHETTDCITYERIPGYLQSQLIPNAKCFLDADESGIIFSQQIELEQFLIYYHLIHLGDGIALKRLDPKKYMLPAGISSPTDSGPGPQMRIMTGDSPDTRLEFAINFQVYFDLTHLGYLKKEFPLFGALDIPGIKKGHYPVSKLPFRPNEVNYHIVRRIAGFRMIGKVADVFFRRNAIDFFSTYLRSLETHPPVMLMEHHRQQLRSIATFIMEHPLEAGSKEALCDRFRVVPEFLEVPFEQEFLISVEELILQEAMAAVFKMIVETDYTLTYIAAVALYDSWEDLAQTFESYYRCPIADLRKAQ